MRSWHSSYSSSMISQNVSNSLTSSDGLTIDYRRDCFAQLCTIRLTIYICAQFCQFHRCFFDSVGDYTIIIACTHSHCLALNCTVKDNTQLNYNSQKGPTGKMLFLDPCVCCTHIYTTVLRTKMRHFGQNSTCTTSYSSDKRVPLQDGRRVARRLKRREASRYIYLWDTRTCDLRKDTKG